MNFDLNIDEKLQLLVAEDDFTTNSCNGKVKKLTLSDGPCGLRRGTVENPKGEPSICYPSPGVLASSWDKNLSKKVGEAIASDCIDANVDIILAPGVNVKRTPLCGRNFEYFSEDPYLAAELAAEYVLGCQSLGIGACVKHFCANNREWDRLHQFSEVDYRTLREIYTKAFELILKKVQPYVIMSSYNGLNGINVSENKWALDCLLRQKLGFNGAIVSDWDAVHDRSQAVKASLDIQFPYEKKGLENLREGFKSGRVSQAEIEKCVDRVIELIQKIDNNREKRKALSLEERKTIAVKGAEGGIVLLKNDGVLPIKGGKIGLVGEQCYRPICVGGGSAETSLKEYPVSLVDELKERLPSAEINWTWTFSHSSCITNPALVRTVGLKDAVRLAYDSDVTIVTAANSSIIECESYDRSSIKLQPEIEKIIIELGKVTDKLVVVLETGSAIDMTAWQNSAAAIIYAGFAGQGVNEALANIITGRVTPSGRLAESFPVCLEDTPTKECSFNPWVDRYGEGCLVGYRWYNSKGIKPAFPFGFGLSYAEFKYGDFSVEKLENTEYRIKFTVENVSEFDGAEVAQLYVKNVDMYVERPERELRRFEKVFLKAGEKKEVIFLTDSDCFEYFNVCYDDWHVDGGRYEIIIGRNAEQAEFIHKIKIN